MYHRPRDSRKPSNEKHKLGTRQQVLRLPALPQEMCIIGSLGPSNICQDIKREQSSQKNLKQTPFYVVIGISK